MRRRKKQQRREDHQLQFRAAGGAGFRASTIDEDGRTVQATLSTEQRVPMMDWERYELVDEVLLSAGMETPRGSQVPLFDSHYPRNVKNQLGSVRGAGVDGDVTTGTLAFSSVHEDEFTKVREGHTTDVSVGYVVLKRVYVPEGRTRTIRGKRFEGPVNVATKWRLREVSLTPIGADDQAKLRGLDPALLPDTRDSFMDEQLRALLVELGLDEDASDEDAQRFLLENGDRIRAAFSQQPPTTPPPAGAGGAGSRTVGTDGATATGASLEDLRQLISDQLNPENLRSHLAELVTGELQRAEQARQQHRTHVDQLCELAGMPELARTLYDEQDLDQVRQAILQARGEQGVRIGHQPVVFGPAQRDKHRGLLGTALNMRALGRCQVLQSGSPHQQQREQVLERVYPAAQRAEGWEQFRHASVLELATECLRMDGYDVRGLSRQDLAMVALGFGEQIGVRASDPAYHTTASFPFIVQDAINKSMMLGFVEFPSTWRMVGTEGDPVPDFKTIHRIAVGGFRNIPIWDGLAPPEQDSNADEEETYAVECRSRKLSYSYKLLVNDDMSMISRQPQKLGDAMARTVNAAFWAQITGNPTMRDGQALFLETPAGNRKRQNLTTGAGAPSSTTIQTLTNLMMQMRGLNTPENDEGDDILALMPRYIVGPSALRTTILKEVRSIADPNGTHSGEANLSNDLVPVIEPLLDADSTTAWYLFADTMRAETVEVTFLQGQQAPLVRSVLNPDTLSQDHYILQTFAAKALDHRGMQKHAGA